MSVRVFVDTHIPLYARDGSRPARQPVALASVARCRREHSGRLRLRVSREYYVNATQQLKPGLPGALAGQDVRNPPAGQPVRTDALLLASAWGLADRYGFSWWDAQIVAAARRADCEILLSEDLQHGVAVDGVRVLNPFLNPEDGAFAEWKGKADGEADRGL